VSSVSDIVALTPAQLRTFRTDGLIRLVGLLPAHTVEAARETVLTQLAKVGLWRDGERPRLMLTRRYERADLLAEVARAWGWT
jgi:hypothetical protein